VNYFCAGVFVEGTTDDRFLCPLLDRIIPSLAEGICKSSYHTGESRRIRAPRGQRQERREEQIAAAIEDYWEACTQFVVHSDGGGSPDGARREQVEPGLDLARRTRPDLAAAACVPVREIEAWMLVDPDAFRQVFEVAHAPQLPRDPEGELDPKQVLKGVLRNVGARIGREVEDYYAGLGAVVRLEALRRLKAFQQFEAELGQAIAAIAAHG
jgi:hypothetical protein